MTMQTYNRIGIFVHWFTVVNSAILAAGFMYTACHSHGLVRRIDCMFIALFIFSFVRDIRPAIRFTRNVRSECRDASRPLTL